VALFDLGPHIVEFPSLPPGSGRIIGASYTSNISQLTPDRVAFNDDPFANPNGWSIGTEPTLGFHLNGLVINPGARIDIVFDSNLVIPEPSTIFLMGLGLAGVGFARRRRLNA